MIRTRLITPHGGPSIKLECIDPASGPWPSYAVILRCTCPETIIYSDVLAFHRHDGGLRSRCTFRILQACSVKSMLPVRLSRIAGEASQAWRNFHSHALLRVATE